MHSSRRASTAGMAEHSIPPYLCSGGRLLGIPYSQVDYITMNKYKYKVSRLHTMLEIRHYDAQSSPIGQYIVIYFLLPYIIYAHLMDRISILSLIVGQ